MSTHPLVLLAHGSHQFGLSSLLLCTAERVSTILQGAEVRTSYAKLQSPDPATILGGLMGPVVLLFFLIHNYHVVHDVPVVMKRYGSGTVARYLGVEERLVGTVAQRLYETSVPLGGTTGLDHIVLGMTGLRHAAVLGEVETITRLFEARLGREVTPTYSSVTRPSVRGAMGTARIRDTRRVGVVVYPLAEGRFHRTLHSVGADVVVTPIGNYPVLTELVTHRYRGQVV